MIVHCKQFKYINLCQILKYIQSSIDIKTYNGEHSWKHPCIARVYASYPPSMMAPLLAGLATLHLPDVAPLGHVDELVDQPLSVHLGQDPALVVVPAGQTH